MKLYNQQFSILSTNFILISRNSLSQQIRMYHEWEDSILLDPKGPYNKDLPKYKRAEAPLACEFKQLTKLEQDVIMNPYAAIIASPIRRCFYHERWFPNAYDEKTKSTWLVPDFEEYGGIKRPGKGRWLKLNSTVIQKATKEGKYKYIDPRAFWRPDMHEHVWNILVMRATDRLQRFFNSVATKSFPAKRDQVLLHVLDGTSPKITNNDYNSVPKIKNVSLNEDNEDGNQKFYIDNENAIDGLQCEEINSQIKQKQQPQVTFSQISLKPFGTIYPVTFLGKNNKMCTQNVPFYNVQCIWGARGVGRFKGFLKIPKNENPMLGMITHRHTKQ
ncbi:6654_t:CDS:2 [Dentiscutata erythropus]|uniref:6654_t:CDS:1 n=1 Tax=Dentiscutata erythropus TaxID=1348616 RepID=A0A9N9HG36_9GLOM|nr:6654_t:CDS:2 [Dentiscutata erythropus]